MLFFLFCLFVCFCVFLDGLRVRWGGPEGPPHLALNPPYLLFLYWGGCFPFLFFAFKHKNTGFPLDKGNFCLFLSLSLCFSLAFFGLPLFQFLFLCLSLSLSCSYLFFFLLVFVLLSFGAFFLSLSFLLFLLCFCFIKGTTSKHLIAISFFNQSFAFFIFCISCLTCSFKSLFLIFFCLSDFKLCFLFNMNVFGVKTNNLKKHTFWVKRGVATKRFFFFYQPVFCKMWKVIVFWGPFFGQIWLKFKKHYKSWYFSIFLKAKKANRWPFLNVANWAKLNVTNWTKLVSKKTTWPS